MNTTDFFFIINVYIYASNVSLGPSKETRGSGIGEKCQNWILQVGEL